MLSFILVQNFIIVIFNFNAILYYVYEGRLIQSFGETK